MSAAEISKVQLNPFYVRKMRTYFLCLDQNKNGVLTRQDHELLSKRYQQLAQVDRPTLRERQASRKIMTLWNLIFEEASKSAKMTPEMFGKCIAYIGREQIIACAHHYADILFDFIDLNADGVIKLQEYALLHELFFLDEKAAEAAFKALDSDNKGYVSHADFTKAVIDFFLPDGEKETATSIVFGPLLN